MSLDETIEHRASLLVEYQSRRYANKYIRLVKQIQKAEQRISSNSQPLSTSVAQNLYKLMAYKDEYEVARLHSSESFQQAVKINFDGDYTLRYHLAPPLLSRKDPITGFAKKREFGPWIIKVFTTLAKLKKLRGTPFDPFGYTAERKMERRLLREYTAMIDNLTDTLSLDNYQFAKQLAALPDSIRGFGHVKEQSVVNYDAELKNIKHHYNNHESATATAA